MTTNALARLRRKSTTVTGHPKVAALRHAILAGAAGEWPEAARIPGKGGYHAVDAPPNLNLSDLQAHQNRVCPRQPRTKERAMKALKSSICVALTALALSLPLATP